MTPLRWSLNATGSTEAVGLLRIALALIIWARYARTMSLHTGVEWWMLPLSAAFFMATTAMLIGYRSQAATAVTGGIMIWLYFGLGVTNVRPLFYGHHAYLLMAATCLLALTPCGKSWSLDRWLVIKRGGPTDEIGPLWAQNLIVLQMASLYFWTAVDKTGPHFLSGERLEAIFVWGYTNRPAEVILTLPVWPWRLRSWLWLLSTFSLARS